MLKTLSLTTEDEAVLRQNGLFKVDNTWIKGNLYFLGGNLIATDGIKYTGKDLVNMYRLIRAGVIAERDVVES